MPVSNYKQLEECPWDRLRGSGSSSWPASDRGRSARCCCRTWGPRSSGSIAPRWSVTTPTATAMTAVSTFWRAAGATPVPPLNLVGDFGGGALYLAMGVLAGIISARATGKGQVIDCSMVEGSASLMMMMYGALASGAWNEERGANRTDGGAHYYHVYETRDGEHVAIGAIEPQFYALLLKHAGLEGQDLPPQTDRAYWPEMQQRLTRIFKTKTRAEWVEIMQQTDICFAPVLRMSEALTHPHNVERGSFIEIEGLPHPAPAPRFLGTPTRVQCPPARVGEHTDQILKDWGFSAGEIAELHRAGAVASA